MRHLWKLMRPFIALIALLAGLACALTWNTAPVADSGTSNEVASDTPQASSTPLPPTATDTPVPTEAPTTTPAAAGDFDDLTLELVPLVTGITEPVDVRNAGDGSGRLFVVSRIGIIYVVQDGQLLAEPFLNISEKVRFTSSEQGMLGLAFDPDFERNGRFFVNYTMSSGDTVIARYLVSTDDPNRADPESGQMLMIVDQLYNNHNGGNLVFGPDGYLYVGLGDGGGGGDPDLNGQDGLTLLGTMLRLDVKSNVGYDIPPDNPFVGDLNVRDEVWAIGLRNPWRYSFDRETGDFYIADVGQQKYEEINFVPAGSSGGYNFGWNVMEGSHCYDPPSDCDMTGFELPVAEYSHEFGCSITGGYVYRGTRFPQLQGIYFFADYCSGRIWGLRQTSDGLWEQRELLQRTVYITSFGEDEAGELYVTDLGHGIVYQLVAVP